MNARNVITITLVVSFIVFSSVKAEEPVVFNDPALEASVRQALGIPSDPIMPSDMLNLTQFGAVGKGITDLTGLEYATNLWNLCLADNQISDVGLLTQLINLKWLCLDHNPINNANPLSVLSNLTRLELAFTTVTDISWLSQMTGLNDLVLYGNPQITDFSVVSTMPNLRRLNIGGNSINDISFIAGMTQLVVLDIENNEVSDISALVGLPNLQGLNLSNLPIDDISLISGINGLNMLILNDNPQITNFNLLSSLSNMEILHLDRNQISDISFAANMTLLRHLNLTQNNVIDISMLAGLTNLHNLFVSNNRISDISVVANMTHLLELRLDQNCTSDISPLSQLFQLHRLDLRANPLSWVSYCDWIPTIQSNNPGINLLLDPNPYNCDVPPEETPVGTLVSVNPEDNTNPGTSPVTLMFEEVTESGGTSLVTSSSGPTPPSGFQLGDPATYYEITTTATYSGFISICIDYSGISYSVPEESLLLYHYDGSSWVDCTTLIDTENDIICGEVTSLSAFAILEDKGVPVFNSITATPNVLWPPNHKMVVIEVQWIVSDNLDPEPDVVLKSITMNEGDETNTYDPQFDNIIGDGHTIDDIQIIDGVIYLRAERSGTGTGRIYTLIYEGTDDAGNVGNGSVTVTVPHEAP